MSDVWDHELVRLDQDARRAHRLAAAQARRRSRPRRRTSTPSAVSASASARGPERGGREPAHAACWPRWPTCCCWRSSRSASRWRSTCSARVNAEVRTQAQAQADLVAATARPTCLAPPSRRAARHARRAPPPASLRGRVLIVDADGRVLVDSARAGARSAPATRAARRSGRALAGITVQVQRYSNTLGSEILATAVPIVHNGRIVGAVRVTQSVAAVHDAVRQTSSSSSSLIGAIVLALGLPAGALLAGQIGRPLRRLERSRGASPRATSARAPRSRAAASSVRWRARSTR